MADQLKELLESAQALINVQEATMTSSILMLAKPLAELIVKDDKLLTAQVTRLTDIDQPLFIADNEFIYGVVSVKESKPATLVEFKRRLDEHGITDEVRKELWPRARRLYLYSILSVEKFDTPVNWRPLHAAQQPDTRHTRAATKKELSMLGDAEKLAVAQVLCLLDVLKRSLQVTAEQAIRLFEPSGDMLATLQDVPPLVDELHAEYTGLHKHLEYAKLEAPSIENPFVLAGSLAIKLRENQRFLPQKTRVYDLSKNAIEPLTRFYELHKREVAAEDFEVIPPAGPQQQSALKDLKQESLAPLNDTAIFIMLRGAERLLEAEFATKDEFADLTRADVESAITVLRAEKEQRGIVDEDIIRKSNDAVEYPTRECRYPSVLQAHIYGTYADCVFRVKHDTGVHSWTIAVGEIDPVNTIQAARELAASFTKELLNSDAEMRPRESTAWFKVDEETFAPGVRGATRKHRGFVVTLARPRVTCGVLDETVCEYFLENDDQFCGILRFHKEDDINTWRSEFDDTLVPYIVKDSDHAAELVPPFGVALLPPRLREAVPESVQYWKEDNEDERLALRDALVKSNFFTADTTKIVDGEIRKVVKRFYTYEPSSIDAETIVAHKRGLDLLTLIQLQSTEIQTLILSRRRFASVAAARQWVKDHGFKVRHGGKGPDTTEDSFRFRQRNPGDFVRGSFRTITITSGIKAVIGRPKKKRKTHHTNDEDKAKSPRRKQPYEKAAVLPEAVVRIAKSDTRVRLLKQGADEERFVLGVVLEPEVFDSQGDIYSPEDVRAAAHWFMENRPDIGLQHEKVISPSGGLTKDGGKITILETYIAPVNMEIEGEKIKKGTWLLGARIHDDELWEGVKSGNYTGWSIGGSAFAESVD